MGTTVYFCTRRENDGSCQHNQSSQDPDLESTTCRPCILNFITLPLSGPAAT